jgi:AraC-like DNA-binding protein
MEMLSSRSADQRHAGHGARPLTEGMRRALRTELLKETCSADTIARLFSISRRTLARRLHAEGCMFRQLTNEVRFEIACRLLAQTAMTLGQVAALLNYSELSAFSRAFRHLSGQPPSAWRSRHRR